MSPSPRRLTFAVGTSLLTASLATVGCAQKRVNPGPEPPHVNTAAPSDPGEGSDAPPPSDEPREIVNTVPEKPSDE